jgi:hypothetical protein
MMNQVTIDAIQLQEIMDSIKVLRDENFQLKSNLQAAHKRIQLLESEVAWAENGYTREKPLDSSYPDGDGYWKEAKENVA